MICDLLIQFYNKINIFSPIREKDPTLSPDDPAGVPANLTGPNDNLAAEDYTKSGLQSHSCGLGFAE